MAGSIASRIAEWATEIEALLPPLATGNLTDVNRDPDYSGLVFITGTPYSWSSLEAEHLPVQSRSLEEFRRFVALIRVLTREQSNDLKRDIESGVAAISSFLDRDRVSSPSPEHALARARAALQQLVTRIDATFSALSGSVLVPDTNALYFNPGLEEWRHQDGQPFTVVITPLVLSELDRHKDEHRNTSREKKAGRLVRQIGEYRRRGRLTDGVPLVAGVSTIRSIATEPRIADSLPWLDPSSPDDRFLASALEVMRQNVRADVVVVTRDVNLQNKLDFAHLPSAQPDEFVRELVKG